ncbi:DUF3824 domain-containing protein [Methylacidiphilum caldifontis]|uniref:DUF3824 domain-containing protein n=1 Tax=Methylacidiphilum caldifontis TaxID=2795386 RepID=UPI001A8D0F76|nr:DUF3824 domain-containing protein [Methylacidiphilum caldifontis]QSR88673.1 DUF3824 domain-containing protein [Methylacidiphilum caldifontis]
MRIRFNNLLKKSSVEGQNKNRLSDEDVFDEKRKATSNKSASSIRKGKCVNFEQCEEAGKVIEVPSNEEFVCPSCNHPLVEIPQRAVKRPLSPLLWSAGVVLSLLLIIFFLTPSINGLFNGGNGLFRAFERKPSLLQAEQAIKAQLLKGFDFVDIKEKSAIKNQDGSWTLAYDVTVRPSTPFYWVPVGPVLSGRERLGGVPKDLYDWAKSHLKELLFTLDQEPGMTYYMDQKRTGFDPNQDVTFLWKAKAVQQPDKSWKFLNDQNIFPWNQQQDLVVPGSEKTVLRNGYDLSLALRQEESQWTDYVNRLKEIDQQATQTYKEELSGISGPGRKPKFLQPGTGGPTTAGEGAGIGAAGGALIGGLAGGGAGAGWGALGGAILGGLGGGYYSYEKEKSAYRNRVAAYHAAIRRAKARAREEKEKLLEQYAQELRQNAQNRMLVLSGFNPSPYTLQSNGSVFSTTPAYPSPSNAYPTPPFVSTPSYPANPQPSVPQPGGYVPAPNPAGYPSSHP